VKTEKKIADKLALLLDASTKASESVSAQRTDTSAREEEEQCVV